MKIPITQFIELLKYATDGAVQVEQEDAATMVRIKRATFADLIFIARTGADTDTHNLLDLWEQVTP